MDRTPIASTKPNIHGRMFLLGLLRLGFAAAASAFLVAVIGILGYDQHAELCAFYFPPWPLTGPPVKELGLSGRGPWLGYKLLHY